MARETLTDSVAFNFHYMSGRFGAARLADDTLYVLSDESHICQYVEATVPGTAIRLPPVSVGKFFLISNTGSQALEVQTANGASLFTIAVGESNIVHTEGATWKRFIPVAVTYSVFGASGVNHSTGLVPDPGAVAGTTRFLREDATWATPPAAGGGITDAFVTISDGTNNAAASGMDTFKLRTSAKMSVVVTNDDLTHGDNALFDLVLNQIDHDALLNFVANEHVDHSAVSITGAADGGLSGGGDLTASRTLSLSFGNIPADTPVLGDRFIFGDASAADAPKDATLTTLNGILDHDALLGFVANEHIDHSAVSITVSTGLTGGGNLTATRNIALDFSALPTQAEAMASGDTFPLHDLSGATHKKISFSALQTELQTNGFLKNVVEDITPQLGGDLDLNGFQFIGNWEPNTNNAQDVGGAALNIRSAYIGTSLVFGADDVTFTYAANKLTFAGGDLHVADGDGAVIGHSAQVTTFDSSAATPEFQVLGTAQSDGAIGVARFSADANPARIYLAKSRATTIGGAGGQVSNNDQIGEIMFCEDTGTGLKECAAIRAEADAIVGASDSPGRLVFATTADAANGSSTDHFILDNAGVLKPATNNTKDIGTSALAIRTVYVGTIELGHASDTTISRVSAGVAAVEGVNILTTATGEQVGVRRGIDLKTANYTFVLGDAGKLIEMDNAADRTFTVPPNASVAFPIGSWIDVSRYGAGEVAIAGDVGVTVRSSDGWLRLRSQYSGGTLVKKGTNEWYLFGDLKT